MNVYWQLFISFFKIGLFTFGGGYAMASLIEFEMVNPGWMTKNEYADIAALSTMTPGPLAINCAVFSGWRVGGLSGAFFALFGLVVPAILLVGSTAVWLSKNHKKEWLDRLLLSFRPVGLGLLISACWFFIRTGILNSENLIEWDYFAFSVLMFILLRVFKISGIQLVLLSSIFGYFLL